MRVISVAELKAELSKVLADVRRGDRIGVLDGELRTPVAMIVPDEAPPAGRRELGFLDGKVTIEFTDDFEMTGEELIGAGSAATQAQGQCTL